MQFGVREDAAAMEDSAAAKLSTSSAAAAGRTLAIFLVKKLQLVV